MKNKEIPEHIGIIPDGNRRWAKEKGFEADYGHSKGGDYMHLKSLLGEARKLGVKYVSLWGFSTENWERSESEIKIIFKLILQSINQFRKDALEDRIRFRHIGRKDRLPKNLVKEIEKLEEETRKFSEFNVQLCLDYGGGDETVRGINKMIKDKVKNVNEKTLLDYMDTKDIPALDLIIRTGGDYRLSGFMPLLGAYAELCFTKSYFPDFNANELKKAIRDFAKRERKFGE